MNQEKITLLPKQFCKLFSSTKNKMAHWTSQNSKTTYHLCLIQESVHRKSLKDIAKWWLYHDNTNVKSRFCQARPASSSMTGMTGTNGKLIHFSLLQKLLYYNQWQPENSLVLMLCWKTVRRTNFSAKTKKTRKRIRFLAKKRQLFWPKNHNGLIIDPTIVLI